MLRHATGYKLANDGHDTRAIQHYLGHKNIQWQMQHHTLTRRLALIKALAQGHLWLDQLLRGEARWLR
jgi:site-specific recombinase XerD